MSLFAKAHAQLIAEVASVFDDYTSTSVYECIDQFSTPVQYKTITELKKAVHRPSYMSSILVNILPQFLDADNGSSNVRIPQIAPKVQDSRFIRLVFEGVRSLLTPTSQLAKYIDKECKGNVTPRVLIDVVTEIIKTCVTSKVAMSEYKTFENTVKADSRPVGTTTYSSPQTSIQAGLDKCLEAFLIHQMKKSSGLNDSAFKKQFSANTFIRELVIFAIHATARENGSALGYSENSNGLYEMPVSQLTVLTNKLCVYAQVASLNINMAGVKLTHFRKCGTQVGVLYSDLIEYAVACGFTPTPTFKMTSMVLQFKRLFKTFLNLIESGDANKPLVGLNAVSQSCTDLAKDLFANGSEVSSSDFVITLVRGLEVFDTLFDTVNLPAELTSLAKRLKNDVAAIKAIRSDLSEEVRSAAATAAAVCFTKTPTKRVTDPLGLAPTIPTAVGSNQMIDVQMRMSDEDLPLASESEEVAAAPMVEEDDMESDDDNAAKVAAEEAQIAAEIAKMEARLAAKKATGNAQVAPALKPKKGREVSNRA